MLEALEHETTRAAEDRGDDLKRENNVGFLRLALASAVIISHAPEMLDGDRSREPLTLLLHSPVSLGSMAVCCFFVLSGYLVSGSLSRAKSATEFLRRRSFRIYPAYVVAYLLSVYVFGSMVGGRPWSAGGGHFWRLLFLQVPPILNGQLQGLPYPLLNGPMWTIF